MTPTLHCIYAPQNACNLLGYQKGELDGRNVNMIMPQPFAQRHNRYIRQYVQTGRERILNQVLPNLPALHKERYVLPVRMAVTKVSGTSEDATFMGVLEVRRRPACWLPGPERFPDVVVELHVFSQVAGRGASRGTRCSATSACAWHSWAAAQGVGRWQGKRVG